MAKRDKFMETEWRLVVAQGWGWQRGQEVTIMGRGLSWRIMKMF